MQFYVQECLLYGTKKIEKQKLCEKPNVLSTFKVKEVSTEVLPDNFVLRMFWGNYFGYTSVIQTLEEK